MVQINDMDISCDTMTTIPIEEYLHQIQHVLNSILIDLSRLQKSHRALESHM